MSSYEQSITPVNAIFINKRFYFVKALTSSSPKCYYWQLIVLLKWAARVPFQPAAFFVYL